MSTWKRRKGGKGFGKGNIKKVRRRVWPNFNKRIKKREICQLCRKAGVKRISANVYDETRGVIKIFLEGILHDAVLYMENRQRKTITSADIINALKRKGIILYGAHTSFTHQAT